MAERIVMPAACCFGIPDAMTMEQAALAEPFPIALWAAKMAAVPAGAKVGILGAGPIGLCVLAALRTGAPCTVYATDLLDGRLEMARAFGADWTGNPDSEDVTAAIAAAEPLGLDIVFECAGKPETLDEGVELLKPGGVLLIVGIPETDRISFDMNLLRRKELRLQNVRRQNDCVEEAIRMLAKGTVNLDPLVTHRFDLEHSNEAYDLVAGYRDGVVKAMIHMPGQA